jgi:GT2 family glycosyltransferase
MPEISVLIVNWNGKKFLNDCLSSLRRQRFRDFETIVVDNGSTDGSTSYVREVFPEVRVVELNYNSGFVVGNNVAYEHASGELIVLLNNDTETHSNWLEEIHQASLSFPDVSTFACKMIHFDRRDRIENCGFNLTTAGLTLDVGRDELDGTAWIQPRRVFGACGGAVAYRRRMLQEIGFLDEEFFMNYEDVDLSFRAQLRGYQCMLIPSAVVYHHYGATRKHFPGRQVFYSQRNIEFVYLKNMPLTFVLRSLPLRLLYEVGGALYFSKLGVGRFFFESKLAAILRLSIMLRKRSKIQNCRSISDAELRALMVRKHWIGPKLRKLFAAWRSTQASQNAPDVHPESQPLR